MRDYAEHVVTADANLETLLCDDMVVEGGHYVLGEAADSVTEWTWERAVALYSSAVMQGLRNLGLMLLVDDFAVETKRRQEFRATYRIPAAYRKVLSHHRIEEADVSLVWEVQLRNRARGDLRSRLKPIIAWEGDGYFISCHDGSYRRLTQGTIPTCNLLMARHTKEKAHRFKRALNLYDLRWECQSNGGTIASRSLYATSIVVYNAYISEALEVAYLKVYE